MMEVHMGNQEFLKINEAHTNKITKFGKQR